MPSVIMLDIKRGSLLYVYCIDISDLYSPPDLDRQALVLMEHTDVFNNQHKILNACMRL